MLEVLQLKNPNVWAPLSTSIDNYCGPPPERFQMDLTVDTVTTMEWRLLIRDGPGGMYSVSLQNWSLHFGEASMELCIVVLYFDEWLSNHKPPWEAYCASIFRRLIGLEKPRRTYVWG